MHQEIEAIKDEINDKEYNSLMSLKSIGNIAAHPDKNDDINRIIEISENEALKLIKLIEHFIEDWYIRRHEKEKLFEVIEEIDNSKTKIVTK